MEREYAVALTVAVGLLALVVYSKRAWFLDLLKKRTLAGQGRAAQAAAGGGALRGAGGWMGRHWLALVVIVFFFLMVRSCCYKVASIPREIAQDGREFKRDMGEIWDRATSPVDKPSTDEPEEDSGLPLIDSELVMNWHLAKNNRADLEKSGWQVSRRRVNYDSVGQPDYEGPIMNTDFMEGYVLRVMPGDNWSRILHVLGPSVSLKNEVDHRILCFESRRSEYLANVTRGSMGLVYLQATSSLSETPSPFEFMIDLKKPESEPSTVRFAYWRKFDPHDFSDWGRLPLHLDDVDGKPTRIGFDLRVHLSRLPKAGEKTVKTPLPDLDKLMNVPVLVSLVAEDDTVIKQWEMRNPLLEIVSEQVRDLVRIQRSSPDACQHVRLRISSPWLLRVDVAVRFRKSDYKKGEW